MRDGSRRTKLAILYGPLLHYRVALFEALCDRYEVTVFTPSFDGRRDGLRFEVRIFPARRIGPFQYQPGLRGCLSRGKFDACVVFFDVAHLDTLATVFFPVSPRTFCWGIWLTGRRVVDRLRLSAIVRSEAALFYCYRHLEEVAARGVDRANLYVAPNTITVPVAKICTATDARDSILFVGSFSARKGLDRLLRVFAKALPELPASVKLILVGDGPEKPKLRVLAERLGIANRIETPGLVSDPAALAPYYARAMVSVSLSQAGLSVLQSMGFGVPFLTLQGSVSGGETLNIIDGVNGMIVADDDESIAAALVTSTTDSLRAAAMGAAARDHYLRYATIENYAQGFFDALEGTRCARVWRASSLGGNSVKDLNETTKLEGPA